MEAVRAAVETHPTGRAMAGHGVLLVARDRVVAHAGEIVVGVIVLTHVLKTEAPVLAFAHPAFRGAVGRLAVAARPLASRHLPGWLALLLGLDPNTIEQRRVEFHDRPLCGFERRT